MIKRTGLKIIKLTNGLVVRVDEADYDELSKYRWYPYQANNKTYAFRNEGRKTIFMHRQIMGLLDAPKTQYVDHIDGNGLNNSRKNLRICSNSENQYNTGKKKNSKQKYKGVRETKYGTYEARIRANGTRLYLGAYKTIEEAVEVYNQKALELHGEYAYVNQL